jgi:hypothetical protein
MKNALLIVLAATLIVASLALSLLDFNLSRTATDVEHEMATYTVSEAEFDQPIPLKYAVAGASPFSEELAAALDEALWAQPAFSSVTRVEPMEESEGAYLLVEPEGRAITWCPLYGSAELTVDVAFADNGDVTWRGEEPIVMTSEMGAQLLAEGEFRLEDEARGLISRPAYDRLLAEALAAPIAEALGNAME